MNRYIDAELLKADIRPFAEYESNRSNKDWVKRFEIAIDAQPTADVVEVVRCKDCRFYNPYDITKVYDCERGLLGVMQDDFCSHGERAEVQPEIIRCEDCKWWGVSDYNNTLGIPICKRFSGVRDESDFCSRAERREGG